MFTQCTACGTWFRVSQASLHAVHGLVRCGSCGVVFSALGTLRPTLPEGARSADDRPSEAGAGEETEAAEPPDWVEPASLPDSSEHGRFRWVWRAAAGVLLVVFAAQLVNAGRHTLVRWPLVGTAVGSLYGMIGRPLVQEPALADYRIEDAALAGSGDPGSTLELSGLLRNGAAHAQPLPLVDLKLMDRYDQTVATHLLEPAEYGAGSRTQLGAHLSLAFDVKLADPGPTAVGFALSVCKRSDDGVRCQPF